MIDPSDPADARAANYFDHLFAREVAEGRTQREALTSAFEAYLDGRPGSTPRHKLTRADRDRLFWSSSVVAGCSPEEWNSEPATLALARYLGQQKVLVEGLIRTLADVAPEALMLATRRSGLVLAPDSPHRKDLVDAGSHCEAVAELGRVLDIFAGAHRERLDELDHWKAELADLTAFDLLTQASLYAFEHLVPQSLTGQPAAVAAGGRIDNHWQAINDLLLWKLEMVPPETVKINDVSIGHSLQQHLSPLLSPEPAVPAGFARRRFAFGALVAAQLELNEFLSRSVDAFCYDDSVRFVRDGEHSLDIVEIDSAAKVKWFRDGRKLDRLHGYWLHRAFYAFAGSELAHQRIGRPENEDENRLAYIRAMGTQFRLREVYGVADTVSTEGGDTVDLFQALLSLELMSRFFMRDFLAEFAVKAERYGGWVTALRDLAFNGLRNGMRNRFPLTWSSRADKVSNITGWTVTPAQPSGSARMAAAVLDFWTYDMEAIAGRLRRGEPGLNPRLFERPVLKFGPTLVQLPWVAGLQNNSSAAINNLRRLLTRRGEARDETQRIEAGLAQHLTDRGFRALANWIPPDEAREAGEVDLLAARDGRLFLFEVKSTFIRQSVRDAWLHATTMLRKAGLQLQRKLVAVRAALEYDSTLRESLELTVVPPLQRTHAWIVDTSIECDHQCFSGFLKVSLEEILVALRDDCHLLHDPEGLMSGRFAGPDAVAASAPVTPGTLYPEGFDATRFVEVIERELVWATP